MSRRKPADPRGEITVYPRAISEQVGLVPPPESGLSVDTDDIGSQFLSSATEQGLSEFPPSFGDDDSLVDGGEGDGTLSESFELDPFGWERVVTRSLRVDKLSSAYPPPPTGVRKRPQEPAERLEHDWDEIDLTDEAIQEASLFDHEGRELGEVESPVLRTDDTHTHGRPRGGHLKAGRRRRA